MIKKFLSSLAILAVCFLLVPAQSFSAEIVKWSSRVSMTSQNEGVLEFDAEIESGWHLYSMDVPDGGPTPTSFTFKDVNGATLVGDVSASSKPTTVMDDLFNLRIGYWENHVKFTQHFKLDAGSQGASFEGVIKYMTCNNQSCSTPTKFPFSLSIGSDPVAGESSADSIAITPVGKENISNEESISSQIVNKNDWWNPVDVKSDTDVNADLLYILFWGFVGGLLALLTPCVWPMIPLTVSFFLKKNTSRRKSIGQALTYGASIIIIYLVLGIAITLIFDAGKLNELATNAIFNIIFFIVLVVFAISFFGAFDIKLPSKWSTSVDSKVEKTTGILSIFFMAFTLVLVSFSCTGPLIGTLLVEAASQGNILGPAVGMGAFAFALAIPFTLFAIFPSLLKDMPKSGGWLNSVKVVLGFLELALSLKFLSVVDLAYGWSILDREVFISLWIVLFVLLGMYLLGKLKFSHDAEIGYVSIPRFFMAITSFSFAVYLLPGLWGAPLKGVSAFLPPLSTQDFSLYEEGKFVQFDNYNQGMEVAAESGRPVLLDFSGYGCVNCRKMEGAVIDNPKVREAIENNFVFITLMVDDRSKLPSIIEFNDDKGKRVELETYGELWGYLQQHKFAASVQPYYIVLDNNGQPLNKSMGFTESPDEFLNWLIDGLNNY